MQFPRRPCATVEAPPDLFGLAALISCASDQDRFIDTSCLPVHHPVPRFHP